MATTFLKVKNRSISTLASTCLIGDGTITLASGGAALFPASFSFHVTIEDEILSCTSSGGGDVFNVTRAQEDTSAVEHAAGVRVSLRVTAQLISDLNTAVNAIENGYVQLSLFDADTFLYAESDDTPTAIGPAAVLTKLTGHADAAFDWNNQNLTNLGNLITDVGTPRDLPVNCGTNKTIELQSSVYEDVQFPIESGRVSAANFPDWEAFTTNTAAYAFAVNDYIDLASNEVFHSWKEGTVGHLHIHITIKTAQNTGTNRFAKFSAWIAYADTDEVWVEQAVISSEKTIPTGSGALTNFYLDLGEVTLTDYLVGSQVKARIKRIGATGGTEYADSIYITQVGMHLELNTLGSRQEVVK